ncbi:uncharacterized protein [Mytilus edulis]|uniref:uncharacterized protein n=1 Tax=Mytilus edulis TaxID=6550 RepID=UPI0039EF4AE0
MMAPLSEEEENYVRLALLLKGVAPRAIRTYFDRTFPPTYLPSTLNTNYNTLDNLKFRRVLNQAQWNLLFPTNGVPDSTTFDVTLMICLIRNLTSIIKPINGFDKLPLPVETTPGADLARIKWYRNQLAHHDSNKIATADFNTAWSNISDAVSRLGGHPMNQECQELKVKILDQSNQEIMLEIKQLQKEMEEYRRPIPLNIRGQIKEELEIWAEDDKMFIETNGAKSVLKCIKENGCVVVTGSSGTGKSSLVRHVALQMQESYEIIPVTNPEDVIHWYNPSKQILFVVDDFCGTYTINPIKFENWKNQMEKIKSLVEKKLFKLIMSCRLQVYKDEKMKSLSFYQSCECNLLSEDLRLSQTEKQLIAKLYLKTNASKITKFNHMFDCFPLLCKLYSKNTKLKMLQFFKNPFSIYKEEIDKLQLEGAHVKYCALALCVMFNNHIKEEWLTEDVDKDIKTIIKNTYEACKVMKGTSRLVLRDELDSLTSTFMRKDDDVYRTIHDKLFDFLAYYFGSAMIYCLIKNASYIFIRERFLFEKESSSDEFIIPVPEKYQQIYINRLVDDWLKGRVADVFCNINMDDPIFTHRFLVHVKGLQISQQEQLASICDTESNSTSLIECSYKGYIDLVTWCLHHYIGNVNHCRDDGVSPLFMACQEGHTEVVQMLITNNADINKCRDTGASPLFMACQTGHTEVVQMLITNNADINKCRDNDGTSPLFIACQNGHTEVVQMLITNNADINKCRDNDGTSPLFIACQNGHTEIVKMLITNNADINKCCDDGTSPLFIACQEGHTEVVKMLITNNADINKRRDNDGTSPLFIACQNGHTEIVKMLITNNADINKCYDDGTSPVFIACQEGHTEVVQMLITNNADINKRRDNDGTSPLFIACQNGHTEIVKMLITNNADINKCYDDGTSPVFIACQEGHTEVVQMLITNNADIDKCRDNDGVSPLSMACQNGHTEVVQMLITNNADINKCKITGESPVFIACFYGHTKTVELLLKNDADVNLKSEGLTPLDIARRENHCNIVHVLQKTK